MHNFSLNGIYPDLPCDSQDTTSSHYTTRVLITRLKSHLQIWLYSHVSISHTSLFARQPILVCLTANYSPFNYHIFIQSLNILTSFCNWSSLYPFKCNSSTLIRPFIHPKTTRICNAKWHSIYHTWHIIVKCAKHTKSLCQCTKIQVMAQQVDELDTAALDR